MKKEDWEKAKSRLRAPLGRVDLLCDGYSVTLVNECISMFRNGIVFEKVLEAVAPLVEEAHKAGIAAAEARLKKHTAVYADFSKGLAPGQQA